MMHPRAVLLLVAVLGGGPIGAAPLIVRPVLQGETGDAAARLTVRAEPHDPSLKAIEAEAVLGQETTLDLPGAPSWEVSVRGPGIWAKPVVVVPGAGPAVAEFRVYRTSRIAFRARVSGGAQLPPVRTEFQSRDGLAAGQVECPAAGDRVECEVPAVPLDLRISAPGHVPHYRWDVSVQPSAAADLGSLLFERGASLSGYVRMPERPAPAAPEVMIELKPESLGPPQRGEEHRDVLTAMRARARENGFFQFGGLRPGSYILTAHAGKSRSAPERVVVRENVEAQLRETMTLTEPFALQLDIVPPVDPWGKPWIAELQLLRRRWNVADVVSQSTVAADGRWTAGELTPGEYVIKIQRRQGVWLKREVYLDGPTQLTLPVEIVYVAGKIELAGKPLQAWAWFGGETGSVTVPVRSDDAGEFRTILPRSPGDVWPKVDIIADVPFVRTTLDDVEVKPPSGGGEATVTLRVGKAGVHGHVIGEDGKPTGRALVNVAGPGERNFREVPVDEDGSFALYGLRAGVVRLRARGRDATSNDAEVSIDEEEAEPQYVELRLLRERTLRGVVRSRSGPVSGARILAVSDPRGAGVSRWFVTDREGKFAVPITGSAIGVTVEVDAPGYAYRFFRIAAGSDPLDILVEQNGGALTLEIPLPDREAGLRPFFVHGGSNVGIGEGGRMAGQAVVRTGELLRLTLPSVEPGSYALCWGTYAEANAALLASGGVVGKHCTSAYVAPFAQLTLRAPDPPDATRTAPPPPAR